VATPVVTPSFEPRCEALLDIIEHAMHASRSRDGRLGAIQVPLDEGGTYLFGIHRRALSCTAHRRVGGELANTGSGTRWQCRNWLS
jgi:hypothetical protein